MGSPMRLQDDASQSEPLNFFYSDYFLDWFWRNIPEGRILLYAGDIDMACNFLG